MITARDVRKKFLQYFNRQGHEIIKSAPLVPPNDPTLMFTNAGMVQFKDIFLGKEKRTYPRATTCQKCIRISGKHNDLENVGRTTRHHTFFEMLGNFSFGDYFKKDAIKFGWELLIEEYKLDPDKMWVSVHYNDDEAYSIWKDTIGISSDKIFKLGDKDNFWAMGETGPCGPCSELLYDRGEKYGKPDPDNGERYFEIWNLVFMQYRVDVVGGEKKSLPAPSIDTGLGLERLVSILQNVHSNFDTDLFQPFIQLAAKISGIKYGSDPDSDVSLRVIADHARMAAFLISEGIFPEKTGREYVLRRVMRRAIRHGHKLGIKELFFHNITSKVVEMMGEDYPELIERKDLISKIVQQEETLFRKTLERGIDKLQRNDVWIERNGQKYLPGEVAYDLYQQDGFPKDLIEVIGEEKNFKVDEDGWVKAEEEHKRRSGEGKIGEEEIPQIYHAILNRIGETKFTGYETENDQSLIETIIIKKENEYIEVDSAKAGEHVEIIVKQSPFYGESGGQTGDNGIIKGADGEIVIKNTIKRVGLIIHQGEVRGKIKKGDDVKLEVEHCLRSDTRRNHSATHLLHWALRTVVGSHATQKGSIVAPDYLRFDFSHTSALTRDEIEKIELMVNNKLLDNIEVSTKIIDMNEARTEGAMMIFEEKYGDRVRMVTIKDTSKELCGGTHVKMTGDIGAFKITRQESVAAGVRRIYAVTGIEVLKYINKLENYLTNIGEQFKEYEFGELYKKVQKLFEEKKELQRQLKDLKKEMVSDDLKSWENKIKKIDEINVVAVAVNDLDQESLNNFADNIKNKIEKGTALIGVKGKDGKANLTIVVTKNATDRINASDLIKRITPLIGGKGGGGRPDFARGGGPNGDSIDSAVNSFYSIVEDYIKVGN